MNHQDEIEAVGRAIFENMTPDQVTDTLTWIEHDPEGCGVIARGIVRVVEHLKLQGGLEMSNLERNMKYIASRMRISEGKDGGVWVSFV